MNAKAGDVFFVPYMGLRLKALRLALGYPKSLDFAETYGASLQQQSNYERGRHPPPVLQMMALCQRHKGATLDWIYMADAVAMTHGIAEKALAEYERLQNEYQLAMAKAGQLDNDGV